MAFFFFYKKKLHVKMDSLHTIFTSLPSQAHAEKLVEFDLTRLLFGSNAVPDLGGQRHLIRCVREGKRSVLLVCFVAAPDEAKVTVRGWEERGKTRQKKE